MGKGEPLVFVHGNAGDRRHWDHQFSHFAQDYRAIRYDVRGFGRSSLPNERDAYSDYEDLLVLFDSLRIGKAHIVGYSMGSGIAVDFVLAYPDRVRSLISVGPWVFGHDSEAAQSLSADMASVATTLRNGGPSTAVDAWMKAPFFANTIRDSVTGDKFRKIAEDYSWWAMSHSSRQYVLQP